MGAGIKNENVLEHINKSEKATVYNYCRFFVSCNVSFPVYHRLSQNVFLIVIETGFLFSLSLSDEYETLLSFVFF